MSIMPALPIKYRQLFEIFKKNTDSLYTERRVIKKVHSNIAIERLYTCTAMYIPMDTTIKIWLANKANKDYLNGDWHCAGVFGAQQQYTIDEVLEDYHTLPDCNLEEIAFKYVNDNMFGIIPPNRKPQYLEFNTVSYVRIVPFLPALPANIMFQVSACSGEKFEFYLEESYYFQRHVHNPVLYRNNRNCNVYEINCTDIVNTLDNFTIVRSEYTDNSEMYEYTSNSEMFERMYTEK